MCVCLCRQTECNAHARKPKVVGLHSWTNDSKQTWSFIAFAIAAWALYVLLVVVVVVALLLVVFVAAGCCCRIQPKFISSYTYAILWGLLAAFATLWFVYFSISVFSSGRSCLFSLCVCLFVFYVYVWLLGNARNWRAFFWGHSSPLLLVIWIVLGALRLFMQLRGVY